MNQKTDHKENFLYSADPRHPHPLERAALERPRPRVHHSQQLLRKHTHQGRRHERQLSDPTARTAPPGTDLGLRKCSQRQRTLGLVSNQHLERERGSRPVGQGHAGGKYSAGVRGEDATSGGLSYGVESLSAAGTGVYAYSSSGTGVVARSDSGTALEVDGAIKVSGTVLPAFVHTASGGNHTKLR